MSVDVDTMVEGFKSTPSSIYTGLMESCAFYSKTMLTALDSEFIFWARIVAILYIILAAYMCGVKGGGKQLGISILIMTFLIIVCFNQSSFEYWILAPIEDIILHLPGKILSIAPGISDIEVKSAKGVFKIFGEMYGDMYEFSTGLWDKYDWYELPFLLQIMAACGLLFGLFSMAMGIFLFYLIMCAAGVYIFMTIGPFCLFLGSFKFSRGIAFAWIRYIAQFCLIPFFASILLSFVMGMIKAQLNLMVTREAPVIWSVEYLTCIVLCGISIALLLKAPDLAAGISGARAGSTAGIAAAVGKAAGIAGAGLGATMGMGSKGAGAAAGFLGNLAANNHQKMWQDLKQSIQGRP